MSPRVVLAPTLELARAWGPVELTVEAEYGSTVVEGALYTAAHHQPAGSPYAGRHVDPTGRPSPCNDPAIPRLREGTILLSHLDLDSLGGVLRALPAFRGLFNHDTRDFWALAEFVDVNGPHKLGAARAWPEDLRRLYAFWAWSKTLPPLPRDTVSVVTDRVQAAGNVLARIFHGDADLLVAGDAFRHEEAALNARTFVGSRSGVIVRRATVARDFCNHLYVTPQGRQGRAVVAYNTATGAVTVSLADPILGVSARDIVQGLWGATAGGHAGIAGSPRGVDVGPEGFDLAVKATVRVVRAATK